MAPKIAKATAKGQITLPMGWRKQFNTDNYLMEVHSQKIIIKPIEMESLNDEVVFDANRDNDGKGVPVSQMIKMLKKIKNERN